MSNFKDYMVIEGEDEATEEEYYAALQRQINAGQIWRMQGSMGRGAMDAIKAGHCICGHERRFDYYGSPVPSRHELKAGTHGTQEFSAKLHGKKWAKFIAAVE